MEPILTNLNNNNNNNNTNIMDKRAMKRSNNSPKILSPQFMMQSRSPSPTMDSITNNGNHTPKPNQVGQVILYGVPIVSLYIEGQERLCLAQISNTLLKQFSYNEIHNRRVALGITCVQCTPVQLEILRRANAMPVSSRRCGMITRREAERLCKSFLGDNSPPRLPDDFAFSVHHECAWGCRGSFLPSRYNSSRAKCIKCYYCGLFFSPNKFIFHSHRISASDKYIQPDAANFNSWRRHLKLSGTPLDEIIHAWEDVKAMFNGGTRKRIISSPTESRSRPMTSSSSSSGIPIKKSKETPISPSSSSSNSSVTNIPTSPQFPMRPLNYSSNNNNNSANTQPTPSMASSVAATPILQINPPPLRAPSSFPQELPFSLSARSFMIDYMWHHQQQSSTSINAPTVSNKASNHFQFAPYSALNWIKQPPQSFLFKPTTTTSTTAAHNNGTNEEKSPSSFNHFHSAFKPVINSLRLNDESTTSNTNPTVQSPASSTSSNYNQTTSHHSDDEHSTGGLKRQQQLMRCKSGSRQLKGKESEYFIDVDDENNKNCGDEDECCGDEGAIGNSNNDESRSSKDQMTSDDENEMVDIETTEDDVQILNLQPFKVSTAISRKIEDENADMSGGEERNNNLENFDERRSKSPIKSLKEIVNRNECGNDDFFMSKRSHRLVTTGYDYAQGLNLKKELNKHETSSQNYIHKVHGVAKLENRIDIDSSPIQIPAKTATGELWSVAKLSLECNNNNNSSDDTRASFYQHLNQIHQRNFNQLHHHLDVKSSTSSHT